MEADRRMKKHYTSSVKRKRTMDNNQEDSSTACSFVDHKKKKVDYKDPFSVRDWITGLDSAKFGSVTKEIENLFSSRKQILIPYLARFPSVRADSVNPKPEKDSLIVNDATRNDTKAVTVIDSDDDEPICQQSFKTDVVLDIPTEQPLLMKVHDEANSDDEVSLQKCSGKDDIQGQEKDKNIEDGDVDFQNDKNKGNDDVAVEDDDMDFQNDKNKENDDDVAVKDDVDFQNDKKKENDDVAVEDDDVEDENVNMIEENAVKVENKHDKGVYVGVEEDDESDSQTDDNYNREADLWKEMSIGLDSSMDIHPSSNQKTSKDEQECDHSYILKDDIGYVCRVCGLIKKSIESIIEFQHPMKSKSIRTYHYEGQTNKSGDASFDNLKLPKSDFSITELTVHPRHQKQMKPHQTEGFNFLLSNLASETPGGCILAHAPGSGKTFLLICFIQSFMAKHPDARPLVILPRGILGTWKKEFKRWQVEDVLLLDMYSQKAENRSQQLEVLKKWDNERSILFLGYQQFSSIVCDNVTNAVSAKCQDILLTRPSILILDEGHTSRNDNTNIFTSIKKIKTPMKVVLSGTLYHNHVTEVFNIINLVRPRFFKMETSRAIKRRILSMVRFKGQTKKGTDTEFPELVEYTLQKDDNFKRKVAIIQDLREMTKNVLHYYKGDVLDEPPGLVDFSVFLKLTPNQKRDVEELKKVVKNNPLILSYEGSPIYVQPGLKSFLKNTGSKERNDNQNHQIDKIVEKLDKVEGVKAKFFMKMLNLCESAGEKLLVFGQYLLPLNFLMKLTMKTKGWTVGKQIFMITGVDDNDEREISMDRFNNSSDSRVLFGSIKACGEGVSLVGASRIIILDVHLNPSVTRQAIGRAFRPGQTKKVYTYRLIAAESPEEEVHVTSFKKESIAKMWFEWNEFCGYHDFEMETIEVKDCGDQFLESSVLNEDITAISKR